MVGVLLGRDWGEEFFLCDGEAIQHTIYAVQPKHFHDGRRSCSLEPEIIQRACAETIHTCSEQINVFELIVGAEALRALNVRISCY